MLDGGHVGDAPAGRGSSLRTARGSRRRRFVGAAGVAVLMGLAVAMLPSATPAAQASTGAAFTNPDGTQCNGQALLMKEQPPTDRGVISIDLLNGVQGPNRPIANNYAFNAIGFNEADGQLYGTYRTESGGPGAGAPPAATNGTLWRISADGGYEQVALSGPGVAAPSAANNDLGSLPALSAPSYPIGDFDDAGHYWVAARSVIGGVTSTGPVYEIGITPGTTTQRPQGVVLSSFTFPSGVGESDFTFVPGTDAFWSVTDVPGSHLVEISTAGVLTDHGAVAGLPVSQYIGMYADTNGNIYAIRINTGDVYAINRTAAVDEGVPLAATLVSNIGSIGNGDAAQCGAIAPLPGLRFGKVVDRAEAEVGDGLTYTLTVDNVGLTDLHDVPVGDQLSPGTTYVSGTARLDGVPAGKHTGQGPGRIDWVIPSLPRGGHAVLTFDVTVDPSAAGETLVNRMIASYPPGEEPPGSPPPVVEHPCEDDPAQSCAETVVPGVPAIAFDKVVDRATASQGDTLTYTVHVENVGTAAATDLLVADTIPAGTTFVSADNGGTESNGSVSWALASLAAGASADLHVQVTIDATTVGTLINHVIVSNPPGSPPPAVEHPCADDPAQSCAETEVPQMPVIPESPRPTPPTPTGLASTGLDGSSALAAGGLLAAGLLGVGASVLRAARHSRGRSLR